MYYCAKLHDIWARNNSFMLGRGGNGPPTSYIWYTKPSLCWVKVKLQWVGATERNVYFVRREFFEHVCFISMYSILNSLSKYIYFYISKNIASYIFLLVFKIVESLQCILKEHFIFQLYFIKLSAATARFLLWNQCFSKLLGYIT